MKKYLFTSTLVFLFCFFGVVASDLTGDIKFWTKSDFLGFDEVGDCSGITGDISSAFARIENDQFLLRISFDNMVERKSNLVFTDNFDGLDISAEIIISDKITKEIFLDSKFQVSESSYNTENLNYLRNPESNLLEMAFSWNEAKPGKEIF